LLITEGISLDEFDLTTVAEVIILYGKRQKESGHSWS